MTKKQKKREKQKKLNQRSGNNKISEKKFEIKAVDGIEIAYANRTTEDKISGKDVEYIRRLSEMAVHQFNIQERGSFIIISEANPNEVVYLSAAKLIECIKQVIPEALNAVQRTLNDYDPQKQFVMVNVFNRKRIAITTEALRFKN